MATIKTLNPQTSSLSDIIAALADTNLSAEAKVQVMTQAADPAKLTRVCIYLNHYFADSQDAYVDDADAAIAAAEEAERRAKAKAEAEAQEQARQTKVYNMALSNLMVRGMKMFEAPGKIDPKFQTELNKEIGKLLKGEKFYMTEAGEYFFVPDSSRSNLSPEQIAALDKADIEGSKSDEVISLEDTRPMQDGPHEVFITIYKEKNGRNGRPNYAVIQVQELNTGKQAWLPSWMLISPKAVDRRDAWRTRYMALRTIALNNKGLGEKMTEEQMVKLLTEKEVPFTVYTLQRDDKVQVYLDPEQYKKALTKARIRKELAEEREYREHELNAIGADPEAQDESYDKVAYKVGDSSELPF